MANQLASNPWIITATSDTVFFPGMMLHVQIEYTDYSDYTHHVEIQDRLGRLVAYLRGKPSLETVRTGAIGWVYGLKIPVLDSDGLNNLESGRLILYYE